jgi:signal transduction histidine kinase
MVTLHLIANILSFHSIPDLIFSFIWFSLLFTGLFLNIYHRPKSARVFLVYGGTTVVFILHVLFGPEIKFESMYILFAVTAALFFDYQLMIRTVAYIIVAFFLAIILGSLYHAPLAPYITPNGPVSRFVFCTIMIALLISKLIFENEAYNKIIQQQNGELIETNRQLKSFNYIFSHDLKEPVRSIISFSQLIQRDLKRGKDLNQEYLDYVIGSTSQLNSLLEGIKTFQSSSDKVITTEEVRIHDVVQSVIANLSKAQQSKNPDITCQDMPPVQSSKMALFIIFKNLIDNAIKYNDQARPEIHIAGEVLGANLQVRVKDNGIGIDSMFMDDVFTMFRRLNSDREKGSGLGLSIVRSLLKKINGSIVIQASSPQEGTTFLLTLPLDPTTQA